MDNLLLFVNTILMIIFAFIFSILPEFYDALTQSARRNGRKNRREAALRTARPFLRKYDDIWRNLRLYNRHCYLDLGMDGMTIRGVEKVSGKNSYRTFTVMKSNVHEPEELWNMFCTKFKYNTTYDSLIVNCKILNLNIVEEIITDNSDITDNSEIKQETNWNAYGYDTPCDGLVVKQETEKEETKHIEIVDINNASEQELTNLPGISVIMAKKAIKKREEIGGFKTVRDFFLYLKIKPHMQENLLQILTVNEMEGYKKRDWSEERNVDL